MMLIIHIMYGGLTYDEAVERVEDEVNLKLTNRIDLSNLDLNFVNNED